MQNVNTKGFDKKIQQLREVAGFWPNVIKDASSFFHTKLINETINGAPGTLTMPGNPKVIVGVQTGNLRRSFVNRAVGKFTRAIIFTGSPAPYGAEVNETVKLIWDRGILQTTMHFYGGDIQNNIAKAWNQLVRAVNRGSTYAYSNPFPQA